MLDWKYTPKTKQAQPTEEEASEPKKAVDVEEAPEGFASKNAKTITFTVMMVIFLVLFGPISVFTIYRQLSDTKEYDGEIMTEAHLIELGRLGNSLSVDHIRCFARSESESRERRTYIVELDDYILNVTQDKASGELSVCLLTARKSGDHIDIRFDDVEAFLSSH